MGDTTMLGPFGMTGAGIEELKPLFPVTDKEWPGGAAWVSRVAAEVSAWLAKDEINRDAGMQVLTLVALRLQQLGDLAAAKAIAVHLSGTLAKGPAALKSTALSAMVADRVGAPLDLPILQEQVRTNRLPTKMALGIIARTAEVEGAPAALKLGEFAATFTSNDDLIKQLIGIAKTSGDQAAIDKWTTRQQEATAARTALTAPRK
jgi:hypothetical protein